MEGSENDVMAEREGFEPSIRFCRILTFQASAFDHSATAPQFFMPGLRRSLGAVPALGKLAAGPRQPLCAKAMTRAFTTPPSADEIEAIARAALKMLPAPFASHLEAVVLQVDDYAEDDLLKELGIEHPLDLTGVYEGIPIGERSIETSGTLPDRIRLFRQAILAEWCEVGEDFEHLVRHILIHEVGHHFGLSDEDMHALEDHA